MQERVSPTSYMHPLMKEGLFCLYIYTDNEIFGKKGVLKENVKIL